MPSIVNTKTKNVLAALTLLEWGAILTYFYCSNRLASYLHPYFRPLVLVTGILLLVSAGCILCFDATSSHSHCDDEGCETPHRKTTLGGLLPFAVLALPIALASTISPDSFGAGFVQNRGVRQTITATASSTPTPQPVASSPVRDAYRVVSILDLMMAAQDPLFQQDFNGKRVELTGRFSPKDATHFELICTLVTCCAADAQLLALRVDAKDIPALHKMAWTKVIGRVSFVKVKDDYMPIITAEQITTIPSPEEQFVYGPSRNRKLSRSALF